MTYPPQQPHGYPQPGWPQDPPPPRKTRTGLIVGVVAAVVLVIGALAITGFAAPGFLLDDQDSARPAESAGQAGPSGDLAEAMPGSRLGTLSSRNPGSFAYCGGSVLVKNERADLDVRVGQLSLSVTRDFAVEKDAERTTFGGSTAVETQPDWT